MSAIGSSPFREAAASTLQSAEALTVLPSPPIKIASTLDSYIGDGVSAPFDRALRNLASGLGGKADNVIIVQGIRTGGMPFVKAAFKALGGTAVGLVLEGICAPPVGGKHEDTSLSKAKAQEFVTQYQSLYGRRPGASVKVERDSEGLISLKNGATIVMWRKPDGSYAYNRNIDPRTGVVTPMATASPRSAAETRSVTAPTQIRTHSYDRSILLAKVNQSLAGQNWRPELKAAVAQRIVLWVEKSKAPTLESAMQQVAALYASNNKSVFEHLVKETAQQILAFVALPSPEERASLTGRDKTGQIQQSRNKTKLPDSADPRKVKPTPAQPTDTRPATPKMPHQTEPPKGALQREEFPTNPIKGLELLATLFPPTDGYKGSEMPLADMRDRGLTPNVRPVIFISAPTNEPLKKETIEEARRFLKEKYGLDIVDGSGELGLDKMLNVDKIVGTDRAFRWMIQTLEPFLENWNQKYPGILQGKRLVTSLPLTSGGRSSMFDGDMAVDYVSCYAASLSLGHQNSFQKILVNYFAHELFHKVDLRYLITNSLGAYLSPPLASAVFKEDDSRSKDLRIISVYGSMVSQPTLSGKTIAERARSLREQMTVRVERIPQSSGSGYDQKISIYPKGTMTSAQDFQQFAYEATGYKPAKTDLAEAIAEVGRRYLMGWNTQRLLFDRDNISVKLPEPLKQALQKMISDSTTYYRSSYQERQRRPSKP